MDLDQLARQYGGTPSSASPTSGGTATGLDELAKQFGGVRGKPSTERTFGEAAVDVPAGLISGLGSLLQFPGQIVKFVPGLRPVGEFLEIPGEFVSKGGEYLKSEGLKARERLQSEQLTEAEKDGILAQFATAITSTIKDPALLTNFVTQQVPLLLGPGLAVRLTHKLGASALESAATGLTGKAAEDAIKTAADRLAKRGYMAAYGTGAAMQAADVASDTYDEALRKAREMGLSEDEAISRALNAGRIAGVGAGVTSLLAQRLPGAKAIEQRLAKVPGTTGRLGSAAGESLSEAIEEGGGQVFKNLGIRQVDPEQPLMQGVGGAAGMGALGGGLIGGALGKKGEEPRMEGQLQGESLYQTAQRLSREISSIDALSKLTEQDQVRQSLGLKTNAELVDMYRTEGYGSVKKYQQELLNLAQSTQTSPEQKAEATQMAQDIQSFLTQATEEEVKRKAPTITKNVMSDQDVAVNLGIPRQDPLYKELVGKDLGKPEDAEAAIKAIQGAMERKGLRQTQYTRFATALDTVNEYLSTIPGSGFYAGQPVTEPTGEGAGVAGVPPAGAPAPGVTEPERVGVVPPAPPAGQVVAGEAVQPPALAPTPPLTVEPPAAPVAEAPVEPPAEAPVAAPVVEQPRGLFAPPQSELPPLPAAAPAAPAPAAVAPTLPPPPPAAPTPLVNRYNFVTQQAEKADQKWPNREKVLFHAFNPNGLLAAKRKSDDRIAALVDEGLAKPGALLAYGSKSFSVDRFTEMMDAAVNGKSINGIKLAVTLEGIQQDIKRADEFIEKQRQAKPEGEVIDVEARVVEETLGPKVNALPAPQVATLEKHYGVSKDSPTFLQRVKEDVVLYATKGGKAVAATIRPIIRKLHAAVLAAAVIFNPTNISPAEAIIFDKQVITETREIRVAPPESVASKMSDGAKEAYSILYPSIKDQLQRDNKLMLIVDKPKARMFVFTPDGQPLLDKKVLLGAATGDLYKGNNDLPQNRVTPAGLFKMGLRDADRSIGEARTAGEYDFKKVFVLDKAIEGEYSVTLFHSVWLKESDAALRAKALKSESETDSRYSFGCINVDKQTYERLITSHLNQMDGASLFIVPDNPAATAEFLTGATARNVSGADGLTRTTFTPAKETVTLVKPSSTLVKGPATPVKPPVTPVKQPATLVKEAPAKLSIVKKGTEERAKEILERQAKQRATPSAPEPGAKEQLAQRRAELVKQLDAVLNRILAKYNLKDVKLNLDEAFTEEGSYSQRIITMALNLDNPVRVLRHEAIHALKDMGFFTDNQWKVLEQRAKDQWIQVLKDSPHTETQSRYDAYIEIFKQEARQKGLTGDALDKYVETNVIEEAIADAFGDYDATKAPPGMMSAILERMRNLFRAIKEAFGIVGIETAEDIFGKIEKGQLKSVLPADEKGVVKKSIERPEEWKATPQELRGADEYFEENGIMPYTSEGQITVPMDVEGTKFSIKKPYDQKKLDKDETLKNDPLTGLPMNLNGTVSLYYPTTNDLARQLATSKRLKGHSPEANRIYLTNESSAAAVENNPGMIDQPLGGANVLLQVDPSMLHLLEEYPDGRKDFFIPIAEGKAFAEKMAMTKLFTLNAPRTKGLHPDRTLSDVTKGVTKAVEDWQAASAAERREMAKNAKAVLREQHNVEKLFGANAKLEKTNIGTHGLTYKGKKVMSTGLGFASAQKINDMQRASTCPQSAICEALCLGETSGQNRLYGGDGQFRSGPRLSQYLKTEALVVNPEAFTVSLIRQITAFRRAANEAGYQPAIRLNVTSDFNPKVFEAVINMFPDVMFYDYTKLETTPIAPNHHLTYSSTGATQVVNGEVIYNKYSNWDRMVDKVLPAGRNVAMAFSSRTSMPKFVVDERTKKRFEVWNGDEYDARFLDPAREDGVGLIIGLTNKDSTTNPEDAAKEHNGFFLDYDPQRDKDTLVIPNQTITEKVAPIKIKRGKMSLRPVEEMPNFKFWFGKSVVVDKDGNPKVMYHGTGKDYKIFTTKRRAANAIFLTDEPKFAEVFAKDSFAGAAADTARGIGIPANKFQIGINKAVAAIKKDYGSRPEGKAMIEEVRKGYDNASPEAQEYMRQAFLDFVPTGPNIMPLYVRAEAPFDYDNKAHVEQVARTLADRSKGGEAAVQENIKKLSRGEFELVEAADVQQAIRDLGFDGFYVKELGKKSLAVYNPEQVKSATGNVGAFGQRPITEEEADLAGLTKEEAAEAQAKGDIRFSLRAPGEPVTKENVLSAMRLAQEKQPYMNCQLCVQMATGVSKLRDLPRVDKAQIGDVYTFNESKDMASHYAVEIGGGNVAEVEEWGAEVREVPLSSVVDEYGDPSSILRPPETAYTAQAERKSLRAPQTDAFKRWFKDSKVVDANGEPMVMYHSTTADFNVFDTTRRALAGEGSFFSASPMNSLARMTGGNIMPVYLSIKNPKIIDFERESDDVFKDRFIKQGHDGVVMMFEGKIQTAVAFYPEQIKSAIGNIGTFDPTSPDIRFSLRAPQTKEFKQWFRKSKIVDADGNPEVMYHGTSADFTVPKTDTSSSGAFFVTKNPQTATNFAQLRTWELDGGANIMPLYVSAENPFDFENPKHLAKLLPKVRRVLRETEGYSPDQITDFVELFKDGDWRAVEFINSFYLFHRNGFDAFYVKEGNEKNLALLSPNQVKSAIGNVGTFSFGSKDIRYSLRRSIASSMTPSMIASMNKIAPQTYKPNMVERILDTIAGDNHTRIRQAIVNRYERLAEYDRRVAAMFRQMGGIQQLADSKAETAALFSDLGAGILETALGAHDQFGGAPVFRNGITQVSNFGGAVKGPILIFKPLSDLNDPDVYRLYQTWSAVKRGVRLDVEGREQLVDAADVANIKAMEASHPNLKALFESVQKDWIIYNNALVKYAQDTGVLTPEMAREYTKHGDYFPFYRLIDDADVAGPKMFSSIGNVRPPKKLKGGEAPLGDFFENIVRNSQAMIQAGIKNVAAQRATEQAMKLNEVTRLPAKSSGPSVYRVLENGKEVYYQSHDPLFIEAIKALNMPDLPFIGLLAGPANLLRNLVTKDPAFMLANMMRDSLSAYVTSGVNMMPMVDTFRNFGEALAGTSPEMQKLWAGGILGGYDYSRGAKVSAQEFERRLREVSGLKTTAEKITTPFTSLWGALEKGTQASDAATRIEVYRRTLAQTGNEAEAMWAALEVMNFNRKGNSAIVRILTAAVPFLNARMQGLDLLYRTAIMPALRSSTATEQEMSRMKTFWVRGMTIAALSTMYWWLTHDDDEYKKQEQEVRDNYWLIPSLGIKIPIPFEVGVIFKVLPERIAQLYVGRDTTKDFTDAMTRHFLSTFAFNPIFQTVLPIYEVKTNYSFFTQRPIIGKGLEDVAAPYQIGPSTSRVAEMIGKSVGYSPMKIDHLIKGYTGTIGGYMANVFDMIYDMNTNVPKASKRFEQMPVIRRFLIDPEARGKVTAYYQMKDSVDEVVRTSNLLERSQNYKEWGAYMQENFQMLAVKDYINDMEKTMKEYRDMKIEIMSAPISADAKRSMLTAIGRLENATVSNIQTLKKSAYR